MTKVKKDKKFSSPGSNASQDRNEPPRKKAKESPVVEEAMKASDTKVVGCPEDFPKLETSALEAKSASGQGDEASASPKPETPALEAMSASGQGEKASASPKPETPAVVPEKEATGPENDDPPKPETPAVEGEESTSGPKPETPAVKEKKIASGSEDEVSPKPETPRKKCVCFGEEEDEVLPTPEMPAKKCVCFAEETPTVEEGEITGAGDSTGDGPEVVADVAPVLEE